MRKRVSPVNPAVPPLYRWRERPDSLLGTASPMERTPVERKDDDLPGTWKSEYQADLAVTCPDRGRGRREATSVSAALVGRTRGE